MFGLDAELKRKRESNYDKSAELKAVQWIEALTGVVVGEDFYKGIKDGIVLCKLVNVIKPGTIRDIQINVKNEWIARENIDKFIAGCKVLRVPDQDLCTRRDFAESTKDLTQILQTLYGLGRQAQAFGFTGAFRLGVNYYTTTEEQISREEEKKQVRIAEEIKNEKTKLRGECRRIIAEFDQNREIRSRNTKHQQNVQRRRQKRMKEGKRLLAHQTIRSLQKLEEVSPVVFGMDFHNQLKRRNNYDCDLENVIFDWIENTIGEELDSILQLKSGRVLCKLINTLQPGTIKKINQNQIPMEERENINHFLKACVTLGLQPLFSVNDLYEAKDLKAVMDCLAALARRSHVVLPKPPKRRMSWSSSQRQPIVLNTLSLPETSSPFIPPEPHEVWSLSLDSTKPKKEKELHKVPKLRLQNQKLDETTTFHSPPKVSPNSPVPIPLYTPPKVSPNSPIPIPFLSDQPPKKTFPSRNASPRLPPSALDNASPRLPPSALGNASPQLPPSANPIPFDNAEPHSTTSTTTMDSLKPSGSLSTPRITVEKYSLSPPPANLKPLSDSLSRRSISTGIVAQKAKIFSSQQTSPVPPTRYQPGTPREQSTSQQASPRPPTRHQPATPREQSTSQKASPRPPTPATPREQSTSQKASPRPPTPGTPREQSTSQKASPFLPTRHVIRPATPREQSTSPLPPNRHDQPATPRKQQAHLTATCYSQAKI